MIIEPKLLEDEEGLRMLLSDPKLPEEGAGGGV